jgi:3,4-dihydroxy 2-butanone 4-phosphate synthase/GTP cyclohydrolase II
LRYRGGVLKRASHTEAAVDLARMAGFRAAGVLAEVVNDDGTMARLPELEAFAAEHGLLMISIADLIRHRRHRRSWCACRRRIPHATAITATSSESPHRRYRAHGLRDGRGRGRENVLVR